MVVVICATMMPMMLASADGQNQDTIFVGECDFLLSKENGRIISFGDLSEVGKETVRASGWDGDYPTGILKNGKFLRQKGCVKQPNMTKLNISIILKPEYLSVLLKKFNTLNASKIIEATITVRNGYYGHRKVLAKNAKIIGQIGFADGSLLDLAMCRGELGFIAGTRSESSTSNATRKNNNSKSESNVNVDSTPVTPVTPVQQSSANAPVSEPGNVAPTQQSYTSAPVSENAVPTNQNNVSAPSQVATEPNMSVSLPTPASDPTVYDSYKYASVSNSIEGGTLDSTSNGTLQTHWANMNGGAQESWSVGDHTHTEWVNYDSSMTEVVYNGK